MKAFKFPVAFYLVLVFLSGVLVGVLGSSFYRGRLVRDDRSRRSAEDYRLRYVKEMKSRLKMTDAQVGRLNEILDQTRLRFRELRERVSPDLKAIREEEAAKIREILDEGQRSEYEKMREERERRHDRKGRP